MSQYARDVMSKDPVTLTTASSILDAASMMRERNIGDVVVMEENRLCGIVTDRDIVIRGVAMRKDPSQTKLGEICSRHITSVKPDTKIDEAIQTMREKRVRRLVVAEGDKPVGVVSLGDLAMDRDRHSVLGDISAAPPNK